MSILADFCQKAGKDQLSGVIFLGFIFVVSLFCIFAQLSNTAFGFTLPQPRLGFALLAADAAFVTFAFFAFWRSRRVTERSKATDSSDLLPTSTATPPSSVRVLISGDGEGMSFWKLDGAGELRAWLDVVNFTSDSVKIDRIIGDITVANAVVAQFSHFKKVTIGATSAERVHIQPEFSPQHIKNIEFQLQRDGEPSGGLNAIVYLSTKKEERELRLHLATGNCRFVNFPRKAVSTN